MDSSHTPAYKIFLILIVVAVVGFAAYYSYLFPKEEDKEKAELMRKAEEAEISSPKFAGRVVSFGDGFVDVSGNYLKEGRPTGNSKTISAYIRDNTLINRTTMPKEGLPGENKDSTVPPPVRPPLPTFERVGLAEFKEDVKNYNPVVTVTGSGDIFSKDSFDVFEISYTITK